MGKYIDKTTYRIYDGKKFFQVRSYSKKRLAKKVAGNYRKDGWYARIETINTPAGKIYTIYRRRK